MTVERKVYWRLKYCTAFSCFIAAVFVLNVQNFFACLSLDFSCGNTSDTCWISIF